MHRRFAGFLALFAAAACTAGTQEIRDSRPELEGSFSGNQKVLASCVAEHMVGGPALVPVLRDDPGPSTLSATRGYLGDQILLWELRFSQIDAGHSRVQLRARKTVYDRYSTESDMWKAVGACSRGNP
jgi:hypothetical protein